MIRFLAPRLIRSKAVHPSAPAATSPRAEPTLHLGDIAPKEPVMIETTPARYFPPIHLAEVGALHHSEIEEHCLALGDAKLRGLAMRTVAELHRLVDQVGMAALISEAVEGAQKHGGSAEEHLQRRLEAVISERTFTKAEFAKADERRTTRMDRLAPLVHAASMRLTHAKSTLSRLTRRLDLAKAPLPAGQANAYQALIDAGLKPEQIALVGEVDPDAARKAEAQRLREQIAELRAEIPALQAFSDDPRHDPAHLAGLKGLDELVEAARPVPEVA